MESGSSIIGRIRLSGGLTWLVVDGSDGNSFSTSCSASDGSPGVTEDSQMKAAAQAALAPAAAEGSTNALEVDLIPGFQ